MRHHKIFLNSGLAVIGLLFAVVFISSPAYATPTITFDYPWYFQGHSGVVTVTDDTNSFEPAVIDAISVTVQTNSIPPEVLDAVPLTETGPDTRIFVSSYINFTSGNTDAGLLALNVNIGDTVTAIYPGALDVAVPVYDANTYGTLSAPISLISPQTTRLACGTTSYPTWLTNGQDSDGDGICDLWEKNESNEPVPANRGLVIPNSAVTYRFFCDSTITDSTKPFGSSENPDPVCPVVGVKDIYVEIDSLKRHKVPQTVIDTVKGAFQNTVNVGNPSLRFALHIQNDEEIDYHRDYVVKPSPTWVSSPNAGSYDDIKRRYFGTADDRTNTSLLIAKRQVFHWALFAHFQLNNKGSSGVSEYPGNDMMISLGSFTGAVGSPDQQAGTLMHELGHNLKLKHGGNEDTNCKPNYLSVMSYSRQFSDYIPNRPLNYSADVQPLIENDLDEPMGLWSSSLNVVVYGIPTDPWFRTASTYLADPSIAIDWDNVPPDNNPSAIANINNLPGCPDTVTSTTPYTGFNDWANLALNFKGSSSFYDGASNTPAQPADEPYESMEAEIALGNVTTMRAARVASLLSLPNLPSEATDRINAARELVINGGLNEAIEELQSIELPATSAAIEHSPVFSAIESVVTSLEKAAEPAHTARDAVRTPDFYLPRPNQQVEMGIPSELIQCNDHLGLGQRVLMIRPNEKPACVLLDHVDEFEALGWIRVQ